MTTLTAQQMQDLKIKSQADYQAFITATNSARTAANLPPLEFAPLNVVTDDVQAYIAAKFGTNSASQAQAAPQPDSSNLIDANDITNFINQKYK